MRGNNKRKLLPEALLSPLTYQFRQGVPVTKLIRNNNLEVSRPHLRKLFFIYIDILDFENSEHQKDFAIALRRAMFPEWLDNKTTITEQPDEWTYDGKFPFGKWIRREQKQQ